MTNPTTTITTDGQLLTLINVFTVEPENQQQLIDVLTEATTATMTGQPGFISANLHGSADGRRVVNYAQWRSQDDFDAMQANPEAGTHMRQAATLATFDPIICDVIFTDHA